MATCSTYATLSSFASLNISHGILLRVQHKLCPPLPPLILVTEYGQHMQLCPPLPLTIAENSVLLKVCINSKWSIFTIFTKVVAFAFC